jgi:hypothetical protein
MNGEYYFSNPDPCTTGTGNRVYKYNNWIPHFQLHPVPEIRRFRFFFAKASVFYNAPDACGVTFVAYMEQPIRHSYQISLAMAALNNQLPDNLPADELTSRMISTLRHAEETEDILYEMFPFGLIHQTREWAAAQSGAPDEPGTVAPARETGFPAALP